MSAYIVHSARNTAKIYSLRTRGMLASVEKGVDTNWCTWPVRFRRDEPYRLEDEITQILPRDATRKSHKDGNTRTTAFQAQYGRGPALIIIAHGSPSESRHDSLMVASQRIPVTDIARLYMRTAHITEPIDEDALAKLFSEADRKLTQGDECSLR